MSIRIQGSISATAIHEANGLSASASPGNAPEVMPEPIAALASSGDVGAMIAALLLESGKTSRETAKLLKEAAGAAEDAAHTRKIDAMETAADRKLVAGVAQGAGSVVEGVMGGTGAATGKPLEKFSPIAKGGGSVDGAVWNYLASDAEKEVAKADREATQAKRNVESAGDIDKDAKDLLRRAMSHYAEYVRAKDDASKAALFRA